MHGTCKKRSIKHTSKRIEQNPLENMNEKNTVNRYRYVVSVQPGTYQNKIAKVE